MIKALKITTALLVLGLLGIATARQPGQAGDVSSWASESPSRSTAHPAAAGLGVLGIGIAGIVSRRRKR